MTPAVPALLAAAVGAGVLVGCTADPPPPPLPSPSASGSAGPAETTLDAARAREVALLAAYDDAGTSAPGLVELADDARVHHLQHLRALDFLAGSAGRASGTPGTVLATSDTVALARALLAAERVAADAGIFAVGEVPDPALRRLLAEIAASEAQHATALYIGLREGIIRRAPGALATPAAQ